MSLYFAHYDEAFYLTAQGSNLEDQGSLQERRHGCLEVKFRALHVGKVVEIEEDASPAKPRDLRYISAEAYTSGSVGIPKLIDL